MNNELQIFYKSLIQCKACNLWCWGDNKISRQKGGSNIESGIVFVPINPGKDWCAGHAVPFAREAAEYKDPNPSAEIFINALSKTRYSREDVFVTNFVKCSKENGNPIDYHYKQCKHNLEKELEILKPRIIIAVGKLPARNLNLLEKEWRKSITTILINDRPTLVTAIAHPMYFRRKYGPIKGVDEYSKELSIVLSYLND